MMSAPADSWLQRGVLAAILCVSLFLTACGATGVANSTSTDPVSTFTSRPGTTATQGAIYTYQIETLPLVSPVSLALVTAPSGATLSGTTLTWTPSAAQSRVLNQFSVTATNAAGSATQSWSVTPAGTVSGSWIDTNWTSSGPVLVPFDWSKFPALPRALVPQPDGSFQTVQGSGNSDGTFSIPNVPGGYYWLQSGSASYWTSGSTFDLGTNVNVIATPTPTTNVANTSMSFNFMGLDPLQAKDELGFLWLVSPPFTSVFPEGSPAGATSLSTGLLISTNLDFSQQGTAFLLQYEPETFGTLSSLKLGPTVTLPSLTLLNGASNTINGTLAPSPQNSFELNVKGSGWTPLFSDAGPSSPALEGADLEVTTQLFVTDGSVRSIGLSIPLLVGPQPPMPSPLELPSARVCVGSEPIFSSSFTSTPLPGLPPLTADQDFGTLQYGDPFPSSWLRVFTFCQTALVPISLPGSTTPISFRIADTQSSALPTAQISPLIGQVQNPTINGMSLFVGGTIGAKSVTLSWSAPSGTTPTGYKIETFSPQTTMTGVQVLIPSRSSFYTAKTSASLPNLQAGQTYVFLITALLDGAANFETRPNRSALPTASVSVVSAPITITSGP
jgi:Fibronectin type III domain